MAFFGPKYPLGSIIVFRYIKPTANDRIPNVMVLAQNYQGHLHGLNLRYLSPQEQEMLQWFFKSMAQKLFTSNPYQKIKNEFDKQMLQYQKQQELKQKQQNAVILKPQVQSPFKTSTFQKTPTTVIPANQVPVNQTQNEPIVNDPRTDPLYQRIQNMFQNKLKDLMDQFKKGTPTNPYQFYHGTIKPMYNFNSKEISRFYRKYDLNHMRNIRVIKK